MRKNNKNNGYSGKRFVRVNNNQQNTLNHEKIPYKPTADFEGYETENNWNNLDNEWKNKASMKQSTKINNMYAKQNQQQLNNNQPYYENQSLLQQNNYQHQQLQQNYQNTNQQPQLQQNYQNTSSVIPVTVGSEGNTQTIGTRYYNNGYIKPLVTKQSQFTNEQIAKRISGMIQIPREEIVNLPYGSEIAYWSNKDGDTQFKRGGYLVDKVGLKPGDDPSYISIDNGHAPGSNSYVRFSAQYHHIVALYAKCTAQDVKDRNHIILAMEKCLLSMNPSMTRESLYQYLGVKMINPENDPVITI